jgi:hypothetical protein
MFLFALAACTQAPDAPAPAPAAPASEAKEALDVQLPTGTPLAALVSTSANAFRLMDGDLKTEWKPHGHKANEGILLRFEEPTAIDGVKLHPCGPGRAEIEGFADGASIGKVTFGAEAGTLAVDHRVRSVFLRVRSWEESACLGEVQVLGAAIRGPRVVSSRYEASSTLEPIAAYRPDYLFDGRLDFGWVEGAEGLGIGETVGASWKEPVTITAVEIWNGYQRSEDHFAKNARAKRIAVVIGGERMELDVPDTMGPSLLQLPRPVPDALSITIEILEATPGTRYPDLVLSELRIHDAEGPFTLGSTRYKQQAFGTLNRARGTAIERLVDYSLVSHCAPEERQLKLRSNNSFVYYATDAEGADEVFDGAWVVKGPSGAGTQLQLYGRRHRTERDWTPYGTDNTVSSTRIAGGKPVFTRVSALDQAAFDGIIGKVQETVGPGCTLDYTALKEKDALIGVGASFVDVFVKDDSRG